jgi:hypothetical protein
MPVAKVWVGFKYASANMLGSDPPIESVLGPVFLLITRVRGFRQQTVEKSGNWLNY